MDVDTDASPETLSRNFYESLTDEQRHQFDTVYDIFSRQYPNLSLAERSLMSVAWIIQDKLTGQAFASVFDDDIELSKRESDLLEWSRKLLNKNVINVIQEEQAKDREESFQEILARRQDDDEDDYELDFDDENSISMDEVKFDESSSSGDEEGPEDFGESDSFDEDGEIVDSNGEEGADSSGEVLI